MGKEVEYVPKIQKVKEYKLEDYEGLSPLQARFVTEYVKTNDEIKAYVNTYGDCDNPSEEVKNLMRTRSVKKAINSQVKALALRLMGTDNSVLAELIRNATYDPRDLFNDDGSLKNMKEIPEDLARCITKISVKDIKEKVGESIHKVGEIVDISFSNKITALDKLMKHKGLLTENVNVGNVNITQVIANTINNMSDDAKNAIAKEGLILDENDLSGKRSIKDFDFSEVLDAEYTEAEEE